MNAMTGSPERPGSPAPAARKPPADWLAVGCSGALQAAVIVAVLSRLGVGGRHAGGGGGWAAAGGVGGELRAEGVGVLDVARRLDPRAATLHVRQPESSVRLEATRAAMAAQHVGGVASFDVAPPALLDVGA